MILLSSQLLDHVATMFQMSFIEKTGDSNGSRPTSAEQMGSVVPAAESRFVMSSRDRRQADSPGDDR